jgi:hypothetical protein
MPIDKETLTKGSLWINLKTHNTYTIVSLAVEATDERSGDPVVVYERGGKTFVRELGEFSRKFRPSHIKPLDPSPP